MMRCIRHGWQSHRWTVTLVLAVTNAAGAQFAGFGMPEELADTLDNPAAAFVDLDLDGDRDLVICRWTANPFDNVGVWLNLGDGAYAAATLQGVGAEPADIVAGRIDMDADEDLVVVNRVSDDLSVLLSDGDGTLQPEIILTAGNGPQRAVIADFNRDGRGDIAVTNSADDDVRVYLGDGAGAFPTVTDYTTHDGGGLNGDAPRSIAAADFNRDGALDLITTNVSSSTVTVLYNNGSGGFFSGGFAVLASTGSGPDGLAIGDWNRDGYPDFAVGLLSGPGVEIFLNNAAGAFPTFSSSGAVTTDGRSARVVAGDLDNDGDEDLVSVNDLGDTYAVLLNNGFGGFSATVHPAGVNTPVDPLLADVDADGDLDLAITSIGDDSTFVYRNGENLLVTCPGDMNGDGVVDGADLGLLLGAWGACSN